MAHVLLVAEPGVPEVISDGFVDGICHILRSGGLEDIVGANPGPLIDLLRGNVFKPIGMVPLKHTDGSVNIDAARMNALSLMGRMHRAGYDSFFVAYISNERFRPMRAAEVANATGGEVKWDREDYNFCRASSQQFFDSKDGVFDKGKYKSPLFGAWFLSVPGISTKSAVLKEDDKLLRDRAYVLGAHESSHSWYDSHCTDGICVMTSGERDGLIGGAAAVPNEELDRKVKYLREKGDLYWCARHSVASRPPMRDLTGYMSDSEKKEL